jgi:hypothetical protein
MITNLTVGITFKMANKGQIDSDWQKARRFAVRLLPAGYLQRYRYP